MRKNFKTEFYFSQYCTTSWKNICVLNGIDCNHIECKAQILEIYSNGKGRLFSSTLPMLPPSNFFKFINILGSKNKKTQKPYTPSI